MKEGIYKLSSRVNGRPSWTTESHAISFTSWTTESHAIWYMPNYKDWAIGMLDNIGSTMRGITSADNNEVDDPQHMVSWKYYHGDEWVVPDEKNDIIVECIDGM